MAWYSIVVHSVSTAHLRDYFTPGTGINSSPRSVSGSRRFVKLRNDLIPSRNPEPFRSAPQAGLTLVCANLDDHDNLLSKTSLWWSRWRSWLARLQYSQIHLERWSAIDSAWATGGRVRILHRGSLLMVFTLTSQKLTVDGNLMGAIAFYLPISVMKAVICFFKTTLQVL